MSNSEAFVETMVANKVDTCFGIVGSAFMDALDIFPLAGIRFVPVVHEQNAAHMADGFSRVTGRHGVCVAQNGPGITNFVTAVAAAYWAHSPVVCITPECGTMMTGLGGFQETEQLTIFRGITKYQGHVNHPARIAEYTGRAFDIALNERGPVQINIPRDYFYGVNEFTIPTPKVVEKSAGGERSLADAVEVIAKAKRPVIISGGGVVMGNGLQSVKELAEYLQAPVATTYLHTDAFPASHSLACGPLGYLGSQAAMNALKEADVVIALGTRLGPFGTNPQYGMNYWPETAELIQVDANPRQLSLTRNPKVAIHGDAGAAAARMLTSLKAKELKSNWKKLLNELTDALPHSSHGKIKPRAALRALQRAMPSNAIVSTDIGNTCSVANSYLNFETPGSFLGAMTFGNCGYAFPTAVGAKMGAPDRPCVAYVGDGAWGMSLGEVLTCVRENIPTTAVVFNNGQWGAEKKNQVLWFGDRYVGSQLKNPSFAEVARSMGAEGIQVFEESEVESALRKAVDMQMKEGKTCVLEIMTSRELGDPFRRDAMKLPHRVLDKYSSTTRTEESSTGQPTDL
ncbi:xsc [Symbiodinium microadriaticum]|nr:xsc [Symbiodinium microadriaticum]